MPPTTLALRLTAIAIPCAAALLLLPSAARLLRALRRRRTRHTPLGGPANPSLLLGFMRVQHEAEVAGGGAALYARWSAQFGGVYRLPYPLGATRLVVSDPRAVAHVFARDTTVYAQTELQRANVEMLTGKNLMCYEGDAHRRQRRMMAPSFSNAAIREMSPIFYDCAHELKSEWDLLLGERGHAIIDVEDWMNRVSLDTIGAAGFSHAFHALAGARSPITALFDAFNGAHSLASLLVFLFAPSLPALWRLPTGFRRLADAFAHASRGLADELLARTEREEGADEAARRSVLGALIQAQKAASGSVTQGEISAQIQFLLLAAYDTTSVVLTWALIALAQHPASQARVRAELAALPPAADLARGAPYLDAVVHETLRLHPPLPELTRVATEDDVLPLAQPVRTADGAYVDAVGVRSGTVLLVPVEHVNRSAALWGADAAAFRPERWLAGDGEAKGGALGHRGVLTFSDGPRICLGKNFALAEIKAVLSVLLEHFSFEMVGGTDAEVGRHRSIVSRPTLAGADDGARMPMIVRRVE